MKNDIKKEFERLERKLDDRLRLKMDNDFGLLEALRKTVMTIMKRMDQPETPNLTGMAGELPCRHSFWACPVCHTGEYAEYQAHKTARKSRLEKESLEFMREFFNDHPDMFVAMPECHKCGKRFEWAAGGGSQRLDCSEYTCPDCNRLKKMAGECTCPTGILKCPVCGLKDIPGMIPKPDLSKDEVDQEMGRILRKAILEGEPFLRPKWYKRDPDLPLNARVAKANGYIVWNAGSPGWWMSKDGYGNYIPDYPNDRDAAWDAFDTYLKQNDLMWKIERTHTGQGYIGLREIHVGCDISKEGDKVVMYHLKGETLAENFCEIIVAHAEQQ